MSVICFAKIGSHLLYRDLIILDNNKTPSLVIVCYLHVNFRMNYINLVASKTIHSFGADIYTKLYMPARESCNLIGQSGAEFSDLARATDQMTLLTGMRCPSESNLRTSMRRSFL